MNIAKGDPAWVSAAACSRACGRGACCAICCRRALVAEALRREEARLSADGALVATTGRFTGRSPKDKYFVAYPELQDEIDWGATNQPLEPRRFAGLLRRAVAHVAGRELFAQDLYAGADPTHRLRVRVITEQAWHSLFARNMFIRPSAAELARVRARLDRPAAAQPGGRSRDRRHQLARP